jgi:hypothetical protein
VLDVDTFLAKPVSLETLAKHLNRSLQYRFEPLPIEDYEAVDVRNADAFLRPGATLPAAEKTKDEDDDVFIDEPKVAAPGEETRASPKPEQPAAKTDTRTPAPAKPAPVKAAPAKAAPAKPAPKPAAKSGAASMPAPAPAAASNRPSKAVNLSDIPEGAVIAKNIIGKTGTLLVAAGTPFRARYARRLQELSDIEGEIKEVWIHE